MSAAEEDTELRDLLIHTLENNGVLNKIKAELRASVFLALEEQERAENKPSLINESLRQFLATRDGRLVAGLLTDFLQHFHLDFTLAVLQPEACLPSGPEERSSTARELGLPEAGKRAPLLLELLTRFQQGKAARPPELPPEHTAEARAKFRLRSRQTSGELGEQEVRALLAELCPHFPGNMLERYVTDELAAAGRAVDEQLFVTLYRRLYLHCRSVVTREPQDDSAPREAPQPDHDNSKLDEDDLDGDSFFDDPIPKPEKTYGWKEEANRANGASPPHSFTPGSLRASDHDRDSSLKELRSTSEKLGGGNDDDYMDDFHSSSQRSEKSEVSIGEDLEGELSVEDLTVSDPKLDELTLDNSLSHLSDVADYLEEVS